MRISDEKIEEVLSRSDIVDVVGQVVHLTKKSGRYWGCCPFHGEKTPSFCITPAKQMYYCFGCHKGGNTIGFVMAYENLSFTEAVQSLADRAGIELELSEQSEEDKRRQTLTNMLMEINKEAAGFFYKAGKTEKGRGAIDYFKKRGLTDETIRHFGLGASFMSSNSLYLYMKEKGYKDDILKQSGLFTYREKDVTDKFWNRAMFPIMDERDRVIAFGGRVMGDGEPKYLNSPETKVFDKSNNLYALNYAKLSRKSYFLLCEGYMDVISLHQAGFTNTVASLGTALTERHAAKISKYVKDVYLTYDSDGAGTNATLRAIPILNGKGLNVRVVQLAPFKDPDELIKAKGAEEYQKRIDDAESSFHFEIRMMQRNYKLDDPKEKSDFYKACAKRLLKFSDELERTTYEEALVKQIEVDYKMFHELLIRVAESDDYRLEKQREERELERQQGLSRPREFNNLEEKKQDEQELKPQRLLLTILSTSPEVYDRLSKVLKPEDFTNDLYRRVAVVMYETIEKNGSLNPALVMNYFPEQEEMEKVGQVLQTELPGELDPKGNMKAVEDIVRKILLLSVDKKLEAAYQAGDGGKITQLVLEQNKLKDKNHKLF